VKRTQQYGVTNLQEAHELEAALDRIIAKMKDIEDSDIDVITLAEQADALISNLQYIEDEGKTPAELDELLETSNTIVSNLGEISTEFIETLAKIVSHQKGVVPSES
jgi:hypothetical protein